MITIAVAAAYWPAFGAGFIWDDDAHLTRPALRSFDGLSRIWFEPGATQQYYPILHSAFWLEHRLWGGAAAPYHFINVALHLGAAVLLAAVLRHLAIRGAWFAAFIFALHPVHVESVAWISEQKNTLSTMFYLGAALAYLRFDASRNPRAYLLASGLFLLALLTKTVTATLPAALFVVFWWQRGRVSWRRDVFPLVPWLVAGATAGLFTVWVEREWIGAEGAAFDLTLPQRCLLAARVAWFYLGNLLWPANLTFNYPRWSLDASSFVPWLALFATIAVVVVCWWWRTRARAPFAFALLFGGALFPVLGFFNVYPFQYSFVADHFAYLAGLPVAVAIATTLQLFRAAFAPRFLPLVLLGALGILTWRQTRFYRDSETLFRATLARNPASWMAHNNLGELLMKTPSALPEAISHLEQAVALHPDYPEALNNLGLALTRARRASDALPLLEKSLQLKPRLYQTHNNLGIALASLGRAEEAVRAFAQAAALNPTLPNIHENWAKALLLLNRRGEADEHFALAARLRGGAH
jgi:protein O-mannosyl-transferase